MKTFPSMHAVLQLGTVFLLTGCIFSPTKPNPPPSIACVNFSNMSVGYYDQPFVSGPFKIFHLDTRKKLDIRKEETRDPTGAPTGSRVGWVLEPGFTIGFLDDGKTSTARMLTVEYASYNNAPTSVTTNAVSRVVEEFQFGGRDSSLQFFPRYAALYDQSGLATVSIGRTTELVLYKMCAINLDPK